MTMPIKMSPNVLVAALALVFAQSASAQGATFADPPSRVIAVKSAVAAAPTAAARLAAVAAALRARGAADATRVSLVETANARSASGLLHVRMSQRLGDVEVYGGSIRATFNAAGELIHLIDKLAPVSASAPRPAVIDERRALQVAMARVHPDVVVSFAARSPEGQTMRFAGGPFFHRDTEVTRVLVPQVDGSLAQGFLVQTWTQKANLRDHTLVGGDGAVLNVERRTASDSYNVYPVDPGKGPQAVVSGPGAGNAQSPAGWLAGVQSTIQIRGNNANAYLDADANNGPDAGGTPVADGNFLSAANLSQQPSTSGNRAVAVQNLFYLNNVLHDRLYRHGFTEAAGNFQLNNFSNGGAGNDPVNAEAQDGGGTDNANFATPGDGSSPRMQMYLWNGPMPTGQVTISGNSWGLFVSSFGPALTTAGVAGPLAIYNDGTGTASDGCEKSLASLTGMVAIVDRGNCNFTVKVLNAQSAGAIGVIIANNVAGNAFAPGGTQRRIKVPSGMVTQADGVALKTLVGSTTQLRLNPVPPLMVDGDLDSDIVYHEYGHGLTWRMIGSMSGPLGGAVGEGASDVVALLINGDGLGGDVVGEYAFSNPAGIRRFAYQGYPLTYKDVTGEEIHNDGEVYAAAMWRLRTNWLNSGRSIDALFDHFVDGMHFTPSTPAFEDMRNGMLASIGANSSLSAGEQVARCALVWDAFAQSGIGDGASGKVVRHSQVTIVESFTTRADCSH